MPAKKRPTTKKAAAVKQKTDNLFARKTNVKRKPKQKDELNSATLLLRSLDGSQDSYHEHSRLQISHDSGNASQYILSLKPVQDEQEQTNPITLTPTINLIDPEKESCEICDGLSFTLDDLKLQLSDDEDERDENFVEQIAPLAQDTDRAERQQEDILSYFDFPDDEDESEAELVVLEELAPCEEVSTQKNEIRFNWKRAVASFVAVSFVFVLPLHAMNIVSDLRATSSDIETQSVDAASLLSQAAQDILKNDVQSARMKFSQSEQSFNSSRKILAAVGMGTRVILSALPMTRNAYKSANAMVEAGEELSKTGALLSLGYQKMNEELDPTPVSKLEILSAHITTAKPHLQKAADALSRVDSKDVPTQYQQNFNTIVSALPVLISAADEFQEVFPTLKTMLGANEAKKYLLIFQNNTEIRPTGGFIGSFAEIKIRNGVIENLSVPGGGSYDLQGAMTINKIAPEPIQLLKARWEFQDGNWFPDFPTSARQLIEFYTDAGGPTVDGVIAVNATYVASLLDLLGEIEMPEYDRTINSENFIFETQRVVEMEYDKKENAPKAFIGDLAPKLLESAMDKTSEDFLSVVYFLRNGLEQKDVQIFLTQNELEREALDRGWGGEVQQTHGDYFMLVDTNLGGGKTDGVIKENVDIKVEIQADGSIINTATISRKHLGIPGLLFTGVNNVDYMRVYVPAGSELISASGFSVPDESLFEIPDTDWLVDDDLAFSQFKQSTHEQSGTTITQEHGKTVFGNWVQTRPGSTSTAEFKYKLPFGFDELKKQKNLYNSIINIAGFSKHNEYSLFVQKQSGVINRTTSVTVFAPDALKTIWSSNDTGKTFFSNEKDSMFAALFELL